MNRLIAALVEALRVVDSTSTRPWSTRDVRIACPSAADFLGAERELVATFPDDYKAFITSATSKVNLNLYGYLSPGKHDDNIVAVNRLLKAALERPQGGRVAFWSAGDGSSSLWFDTTRPNSHGDFAIVDDEGTPVASSFRNSVHDQLKGLLASRIESTRERLEALTEMRQQLVTYDVVIRQS